MFKNLFKKLVEQGSIEAEIKIANIAKFFERIAQFDRTSSDKSVLSFLENIELVMSVSDEVSATDIDPDLDAVNLMTAHSAKGLEWPVVFVANMVFERFPSRSQGDRIPIPDELIRERLPQGDFHLQEERRLFYVAITRAKESLFLSWAVDYGGKRARKISPFVLELFDDPDVGESKHKLTPLEKINRFEPVRVQQSARIFKRDSLVRLSRAQIDDYFTCPFKFYLASIVRIPLPGSWHFMYGTAIHEAISRYYQRKMLGEKPTLQSLKDDYEQSFRSEGFITRQHEEEKKRQGNETLKRFYIEDRKSSLMPDAVEEDFEFRINDILIRGRYDLVVKSGGGEIMDYKTSQVDDQEDANARIKKSTQMKIYALAWQSRLKSIPKTTLIFIESDIRASQVFKQKDLDKTQEMILEVAEGIKKGVFKAVPNPYQCRNCPFRDTCPDSLA